MWLPNAKKSTNVWRRNLPLSQESLMTSNNGFAQHPLPHNDWSEKSFFSVFPRAMRLYQSVSRFWIVLLTNDCSSQFQNEDFAVMEYYWIFVEALETDKCSQEIWSTGFCAAIVPAFSIAASGFGDKDVCHWLTFVLQKLSFCEGKISSTINRKFSLTPKNKLKKWQKSIDE